MLQDILALLNLLINLLELIGYSILSHTYRNGQVGKTSTRFVPATPTFLIEHLKAAGLHYS